MTTITTKLVKDGNSTAVRLPKAFLQASGLSGMVRLRASEGKITILKATSPRQGWEEKMDKVIRSNKKAQKPDPELLDWDALVGDGL